MWSTHSLLAQKRDLLDCVQFIIVESIRVRPKAMEFRHNGLHLPTVIDCISVRVNMAEHWIVRTVRPLHERDVGTR